MRIVRSRSLAGFSLAELLIAIAIVGVLAAISLPRLGRIRAQSQLASASRTVTRALMAARQSAIQRGRHSYFKKNGNSVWVIVDTTGVNSDSVLIIAAMDVSESYGIQISAPSGLKVIEYDPRGVANSASQTLFEFTNPVTATKDSICVSKLGNTIRERCP
jgi:prepilin-type N-terminal cleavage/methylation domain-containing protein